MTMLNWLLQPKGPVVKGKPVATGPIRHYDKKEQLEDEKKQEARLRAEKEQELQDLSPEDRQKKQEAFEEDQKMKKMARDAELKAFNEGLEYERLTVPEEIAEREMKTKAPMSFWEKLKFDFNKSARIDDVNERGLAQERAGISRDYAAEKRTKAEAAAAAEKAKLKADAKAELAAREKEALLSARKVATVFNGSVDESAPDYVNAIKKFALDNPEVGKTVDGLMEMYRAIYEKVLPENELSANNFFIANYNSLRGYLIENFEPEMIPLIYARFKDAPIAAEESGFNIRLFYLCPEKRYRLVNMDDIKKQAMLFNGVQTRNRQPSMMGGRVRKLEPLTPASIQKERTSGSFSDKWLKE